MASGNPLDVSTLEWRGVLLANNRRERHIVVRWQDNALIWRERGVSRELRLTPHMREALMLLATDALTEPVSGDPD